MNKSNNNYKYKFGWKKFNIKNISNYYLWISGGIIENALKFKYR